MTRLPKAFLLAIVGLMVYLAWQNQRFTPQSLSEPEENFGTTLDSGVKDEVVDTREESYLVERVIDGDTVMLVDGRIVRYIGIDAPETAQGKECFALEATQKNRELVEGKSVRLVKDVSETDHYGRLLRYVYLGNVFVNDFLVREGFATVSTFPPDVAFLTKFQEAQREAFEASKGLWGECAGQVQQVDQVGPVDQVFKNNDLNCSTNTYNCSNFRTKTQAQKVFDACGGITNDVHRLDGDGDGVVCENLP